MKKIKLILTIAFFFFVHTAWAGSFIVKKIRVEGLQRLSSDTVINYFPVHVGQRFSNDIAPAAIHALYSTDFFDDIALGRVGDTLVVHVTERPTIGKMEIKGNSLIKTEQLKEVMKSVGISEGFVYNRAVIDKIQKSLLEQYHSLGRHNAMVDVTATEASQNRKLIKINIDEGKVAVVRDINFIGNHVFSSRQLRQQMTFSESNLWYYIMGGDEYSKAKLDQSLGKLTDFYIDHGYLKFKINSKQVSMTPDKRNVHLTIVVSEGSQYHIKGFKLAGEWVLPEKELRSRVKIKNGDVFSRRAIMQSERAISETLGDKSYAFSHIQIVPAVDEVHKTVFLTFLIKPGKHIYVHQVHFAHHTRTDDVVLRREIQQLEGAPVSNAKIKDSLHRLKLLPFLRNAKMSLVPVQDQDDQVDLNYVVEEHPAASANFSVGYSRIEGPLVAANFNQQNFLGTGKTFGFDLSHTVVKKSAGFVYTNPYDTPDGISRTIEASATRFNPGRANISDSYTSNEYDARMLYSIPISDKNGVFDRLKLGVGYENILIKLTALNSTEVRDFLVKHGRQFQQLQLLSGWVRDSRDRAIFPTRGTRQAVGLNVYLPVTKKSLYYYTLDYNIRWYHPLVKGFIGTASGTLSGGRSLFNERLLPFYKNYYAGGMGSLRGYTGNSLGPRDSNGDAMGGNLLTVGSLGIILPPAISKNLRTTLFVDGGNVFNTFSAARSNNFSAKQMRYSTGVEFDWLSPMGIMLDFSVAEALHKQHGDHAQLIDFSIGANFG